MDNEATKILNTGSENQKPKGVQAEQKDVKKVTESMGRAAAAAVGAAVGVGAVEAAERVYDRTTVQAEEEPEMTEEIQLEPQMPTESAAHIQTTTHGERLTITVDYGKQTPETPDAVPTDASYIDDDPATSSSSFDSDNEVHVVGVAIQDNGNGGMATIAGLRSGEETVIVVDVDSDGTIDIIGKDENHNGQFEQNELHDASTAQLSTGQILSAYVEEAHEQGNQAVVTNLDDGSLYLITESEDGYGLASLEDESNQNMYEASNDTLEDDMPDYMNDADAGFMDV